VGAGTAIFLTQISGSSAAVGNAAGESVSGTVNFYNPEASQFFHCQFATSYMQATASASSSCIGGGSYLTSAAITGIRFLFSSGNIATGRVRLFGYRK